MLGSAPVGVEYPALYALATHATIVPYGPLVAYVDIPYTVTFAIEGGPWDEPTTWQLINTVLPPCLVWDARTHTIRGIPMRVSTTTVTIRATDATGRVLTRTYPFFVRPTP